MTEISAPLPQSDKCLLAQQLFLTSYNSFCFVLATGTALWCLLLLKKQQLVAHACRWPYSSWGGWTSWPFRVPFNSNDSEARCRCSCRECWQRCMCRGVPSELPCLQAGIPLIWKKTWFQSCLCLLFLMTAGFVRWCQREIHNLVVWQSRPCSVRPWEHPSVESLWLNHLIYFSNHRVGLL